MQIIDVSINELVLHPQNVRMHPKAQIREYVRSLKKFGQTKNAVIDENNVVLIGNGLVLAARELGIDMIHAVRMTGMSEKDKMKLMLSDNKIFQMGQDNLSMVETIMQQLIGDTDIPGYDADMLHIMFGNAQVVTDNIMNFGKLPENEIEKRKHNEEVKQQAWETQSDDTDDSERQSYAQERKYIVCPACGEKIWQ